MIAGPPLVAELVDGLRRTQNVHRKTKDILRASGLPLLPTDNAHVASNRKKIRKAEALSPILLVRGEVTANRVAQIADGYHRVCASYYTDENTDIPCRIVDLPSGHWPDHVRWLPVPRPCRRTPGTWVQWRGVRGLIDSQRSATGKREVGDHAPSFGLRIGAGHSAFSHLRNERLDVIADQKQLLRATGVRRVYGYFGWWQGEDQPTAPGVDEQIVEHVSEERPIRLRVGALQDDVRSTNHVQHSSSPQTQAR